MSAKFVYGDVLRFENFEDMVAMRPSGAETPWHWLSFADASLPKGQQFLGVAIVRAGSFLGAVSETHQRGINPGGDVQGVEIPDDRVPAPELRNRLLSRAEIEAAGL